MKFIFTLYIVIFFSCSHKQQTPITQWQPYDQAMDISINAKHENPRMQFKLIQSKVLDKNQLWNDIKNQISDFTEAEYQRLLPLILEQNINTIQAHITSGNLTYRLLTQWYLYRILRYESDYDKSLHSIISINTNAVSTATLRDNNAHKTQHPIYGMPILVKDNINTEDMPTTAGAVALKNNQTGDAQIIKNIKKKGGIILGKVNLSEWAYYFCSGCPLGYSAIGGQTLNPYGPKIFETGGSSAGSGTTMAANYAVAAIGTETSGSILSPSSQNSIVGLKPTIGLLSSTGIIPISSTLDTPGPMTRCVSDNAILLDAMIDSDTIKKNDNLLSNDYLTLFKNNYISDLRLGVIKEYLKDTLYQLAIQDLIKLGAEIIEYEPENIVFEQFRTFLNADMQKDFPAYMSAYSGSDITIKNIEDVIEFNMKDSLIRAPYGQSLFEAVANEDISDQEFENLKIEYEHKGKQYFDTPIKNYNLDAIVSINNYDAGHAAMAKYPCLTVPMGYMSTGQPKNITFIAQSLDEQKLLNIAYSYEKYSQKRMIPTNYKN